MSYNPGANTLTSVPNVLLLPTTTTPGTPPASGFELLYFKTSDGNLYKLNSSGTETQIGSGGGGGANTSLSNLVGPTSINADLLFQAGINLGSGPSGTFAQVVIQDITYVANYPGSVFNNYSIKYLDGTPAGSEFVTVQHSGGAGFLFTVHMQDGVSTDTQIAAAWGNNALVSNVITPNDDGADAPQNATGGFESLTGGVDDGQCPITVNTNQLLIFELGIANGDALHIYSDSINGAQITLESDAYGGLPWIIASHATTNGDGLPDSNSGALQFVNDNPQGNFVHSTMFPDGTFVTGGLTANGNSGITGNLNVSGNIGTSATSAASTLGTVIAKWPIYNETGTLIGYVPIYDNIT